MGNVGNIDGSYLVSACDLYSQDVKNKMMSMEQASFLSIKIVHVNFK